LCLSVCACVFLFMFYTLAYYVAVISEQICDCMCLGLCAAYVPGE
jgi:hypothetical protein